MNDDFPQKWLQNLMDSGFVRALAEGGATRGAGKRGRGGSSNALPVYLAILSREDLSPSLAEIQRLTGIGSPNTVRGCIDTLETYGALKVSRLQGGNVYEVLPLPGLGLPESNSTRRRAGSRKERITVYRSLDGHVLRSEVELVVDILLVLHGVPHATEVPYSAIFASHAGKHTMDFLLTPNIGIEVWGSSGPDYEETRRLKERLALEHGFTLHGVRSFEDAYRLGPLLAATVGKNFGGASLEELHRLLRLYRQSPAHRDTLPGMAALKARVAEVEAAQQKDEERLRFEQAIMESRRDESGRLPNDPWYVDPRAVRRRPAKDEVVLTSPELQDAHRRINEAAVAVRSAAELLGRKVLPAGDNPEQSWAEGAAHVVKNARENLDRADCGLGYAQAVLEDRCETPAQAEARRQREAEAAERDKRVVKALRLLNRVEAAVRAEGNPYAECDARRALEAKQALLRAAMLEACPELADRLDGEFENAVRTIEDELHPEELADIL